MAAWWWPWSGGSNYTQTIVAAVEGAAMSGPVPSPAATAAAEACAGLLARSLALATVRGSAAAVAAVTPSWLRRVGYDLIRGGEHLAVLEVDAGAMRLRPASTWTFWDSSTPGAWRVQVQIPRPSHGSETIHVAAGGFVSILWSENFLQPWRGVGPLSGASLTSSLLAASHRSLGAEQGQPVGELLAVPKSDESEVADLKATLGQSGRLHLVESTASGWSGGKAEAPRNDYRTERFGGDPPQGSVLLQESIAKQVIAACGVPLELLADVAGAQRREAYREFVSTTCEAVGMLVAEALTATLETPIELTFERLHASDMAGRARAAGSLVKAGWSPQEAAAAVGLDPPAATAPPPTQASAPPMADGAP